MRTVLTLTCLLMSSAAMAGDAGCWLQDQRGDRLVFSDNPWVWTYQPAKGTPELCAFGQDPDTGAHTITCAQHEIDAVVYGTKTGARIIGRKWTRECPPDVGL